MTDIPQKIFEASEYIKEKISFYPLNAIVLGTGLGKVVEQLKKTTIIHYEEIPHFAATTVENHSGKMHVGILNNKEVIILAGRFHYYEGFSMEEISFPIRVLKSLGVENLIITNISGGLNPIYEAGNIVLVEDHINLLPDNPLRGPNYDALGPRFPDMANVYDKLWIQKAVKVADNLKIKIHFGVYVCLQGPNLETKAEYEYLHRIGGDMVGMSSVPEAIVARHMAMKILMISMISNVCYPPENIVATTAGEIIKTVTENAWKMEKMIVACI